MGTTPEGSRSGQAGARKAEESASRHSTVAGYSPSPRLLAGRTDPARRVRPVDWSATGAVTGGGQDVQGGQNRQGDAATGGPSARLPKRRRRRAETIELPGRLGEAPAEAVHSLAPEDPRPAPRPLRIRDADIRTVGVSGVDTEQVVHAVAEPQDAWSADAGASDHFLREGIVVQVRRADNAVIGVFSARYALSVRPEKVEKAEEIAELAAGPSARGGQGTRHPTTRRELIARMQEAGFEIAAGASHGRVTHPEHPGLFVPLASTPSDRRFTRHAVAQIRRVFGIDLRR